LFLNKTKNIHYKIKMEVILPKTSQQSLEDLVKYYIDVQPKFSSKDICLILNEHRGKCITTRQLRYLCQKKGWKTRKKVDCNLLEKIVTNELGKSVHFIHCNYKPITNESIMVFVCIFAASIRVLPIYREVTRP